MAISRKTIIFLFSSIPAVVQHSPGRGPTFSSGGGGGGGGAVQKLIPIEAYRTCDLGGGGSGPLVPLLDTCKIFQPKHMLWGSQKNILMRWFFFSTKNICLN